jgi:hypothetical protein
VISPTQRPLPDNTQHLQQTDIYAHGRGSNPQSQQASGRRPTSGDRPASVSNINSSDICLFTRNFIYVLLVRLTDEHKETTNTRHLSCPNIFDTRRMSTRTHGTTMQIHLFITLLAAYTLHTYQSVRLPPAVQTSCTRNSHRTSN